MKSWRYLYQMDGILFKENFIDDPDSIFKHLVSKVDWDERMAARKTASYGKAYNYSQMAYPFQPFLPELESIIEKLDPVIGFTANNCLINYYLDGKSKMGFHSDQTDILHEGTGIAIISLGETRDIQFKNILNPDTIITYGLSVVQVFIS